jgi:hypothetical protein
VLKFLRKAPPYVDEALSDLAAMLLDFPEDPTPLAEMLRPEAMDFSLESLDHLNSYLDEVRHREPDERATAVICLRAGAYLGEVIRRSAGPTRWHWIDFENASKLDPTAFAQFGRSISTSAVLYGGDQGFCFPLAKIAKYLDEGSAHDTRFFTEAMLATWKEAE